MSPIVKYGGGFLVVVFGLVIYGALKEERPTPVTVKPQPSAHEVMNGFRESPPLPDPPEPVKAEQLIADYKENEIAADNKYKGKLLRVVGTVRKIEKFAGDPIVSIGSRWDHVLCYFPKDTKAPLEQIKNNAPIILDGRCKGAGAMGSVILQDCEWPTEDEAKKTPLAWKWLNGGR